MNFNKKIFFLFSITLLIGIGIYFAIKKPGSNNCSISNELSNNGPSNDFITALQSEEKLIFDELEKLGLSKNELDALQIDHRQEYIDCRKKLENNEAKNAISNKTLSMINRVASDFNVNPADLKIIHIKDQGYPACATDYQLLIDEDNLLEFSENAQEFIIAHELQHLLLKDDSTRVFISSSIPRNPQLLNDPNFIINKINRFQEKRADTLATLKHPRYAQGSISFHQELFKQRGTEGAGITHPKISDRLNLAKSVLQLHNNAVLA